MPGTKESGYGIHVEHCRILAKRSQVAHVIIKYIPTEQKYLWWNIKWNIKPTWFFFFPWLLTRPTIPPQLRRLVEHLHFWTVRRKLWLEEEKNVMNYWKIIVIPTPHGQHPNNTPNECLQILLSLSFLVLQEYSTESVKLKAASSSQYIPPFGSSQTNRWNLLPPRKFFLFYWN